ncbi:hypothetical protein SAMN05421881_103233 [Nitrosomonas halophila]|uniref:Uncharacterized protein n=1 Tax=Nitrosomonas halophila TaxID=44576 RepID=A0A1H3JE79_9PROT|nr:hypothetical protein SAMN05421881_103233 [Nitrosomonas halophila]
MEIKQGIISSGLSGVSRLAMLWAFDKAYPFGGWSIPKYGSETEAATDGQVAWYRYTAECSREPRRFSNNVMPCA